MSENDQSIPSGGASSSFRIEGEAQIERSETLSALASYFARWAPLDSSLSFGSPEGARIETLEEGLVTFSFKDPDFLIHPVSERCTQEYPHHIDTCGEFE